MEGSAIRPVSIVYAEAKRLGFKPKVDQFSNTKTGKFTRKMDKVLPGKHTKVLYDRLSKIEASIFSQLRTGRSG